MIVLQDENNITDLIAITHFGVYPVHVLCRRQHYAEVLDYLTDTQNVTRHKFPYNLGRRCRFKFYDAAVEGIVTAYDPSDVTRAFQLDFEDVSLSSWRPRSSFTLIPRPRTSADLHLAQHHKRQPLRILELCSGPHCSFSSTARHMFPDSYIVTLDINPVHDDTISPHHISADITKWDYLKYFDPGFFDIIWASPPCDKYSRARTTGPTVNYHIPDQIVTSVLRIIQVAQPHVWFIENPHGALRDRPFMQPLHSMLNECTFCMYGTLYRKHTDIWSNIPCQLQKCSKTNRCACLNRYGKHLQTAQSGPAKTTNKLGITAFEANEIPHRLCLHLLALAGLRILRNSGQNF